MRGLFWITWLIPCNYKNPYKKEVGGSQREKRHDDRSRGEKERDRDRDMKMQ